MNHQEPDSSKQARASIPPPYSTRSCVRTVSQPLTGPSPYVEHRRVYTQQAQEQLGATKCGKGSVCPWQPRPQEGYVAIQTVESLMGLEDTHQ